MDAESSQTSTKFYLNDPKFITLYKPSGDSEGTKIQSYQCGYTGCDVTVSRKHDLITRHWGTHFPLADGEGTRCYYCGHVTRQRANMKIHEQRCRLAPHNLVAPVGLQRAQRRPRSRKTAPLEKATASTSKKAAASSSKKATTSTQGRTTESKKGKERQTQTAAHDAPSGTDSQAAIIHRSTVDESLINSQETAQRALDVVRAERKRRRESEAGPSKRPERRRKLDGDSERRALPRPPIRAVEHLSLPPPPLDTDFLAQTMRASPRPTVPTPRRTRRRTTAHIQDDAAHPSGSANHAPLSVDAIPDSRAFTQRAHYTSDERQVMGGSRTPQMPAGGAPWPAESSAMARQRDAYQRGGGLELASTTVSAARAEPWGEGDSRALGALDFAAMQWPPPEQQPIAAAPYAAAQQGPSQFSGWEYVEQMQAAQAMGVESSPAVDGPFCAPPYEAEYSPVDVDGTVAPPTISLPSLPAVMATLATRPEFERDVAGQSGRNHWRAAPVAWSPISDWQQGHNVPVHTSTNTVDTIYADGVASRAAPTIVSDAAQNQYPSYSAHTLVRRGSSSSGSSNGGGTVLMTPPDHAADTVLQPESYYYGNASGYGASRNARIVVVDPPQAFMVDPNYFASAGYTGQPYYEMGSNYGYDT